MLLEAQGRARDLHERTCKIDVDVYFKGNGCPPTSSLFLPHSEQNVLKQTSFFTPERTGRLIFALAIKIEEEAPAVSSVELSGRVLQAVPPSVLTWLRPSAPRLCYQAAFALHRTSHPRIQAWSFRTSGGEFLATPLLPRRPPRTHPPMPHLSVLGPWVDNFTVKLSPLHLGLGCCLPGFTYM